MWDLIVLIPDHCLSIYFLYILALAKLENYVAEQKYVFNILAVDIITVLAENLIHIYKCLRR